MKKYTMLLLFLAAIGQAFAQKEKVDVYKQLNQIFQNYEEQQVVKVALSYSDGLYKLTKEIELIECINRDSTVNLQLQTIKEAFLANLKGLQKEFERSQKPMTTDDLKKKLNYFLDLISNTIGNKRILKPIKHSIEAIEIKEKDQVFSILVDNLSEMQAEDRKLSRVISKPEFDFKSNSSNRKRDANTSIGITIKKDILPIVFEADANFSTALNNQLFNQSISNIELKTAYVNYKYDKYHFTELTSFFKGYSNSFLDVELRTEMGVKGSIGLTFGLTEKGRKKKLTIDRSEIAYKNGSVDVCAKITSGKTCSPKEYSNITMSHADAFTNLQQRNIFKNQLQRSRVNILFGGGILYEVEKLKDIVQDSIVGASDIPVKIANPPTDRFRLLTDVIIDWRITDNITITNDFALISALNTPIEITLSDSTVYKDRRIDWKSAVSYSFNKKMSLIFRSRWQRDFYPNPNLIFLDSGETAILESPNMHWQYSVGFSYTL